MILGIHRPITLWETVGLLQVAQSIENCQLSSMHLAQELLQAALLPTDVLEPDKLIDMDGPYRTVDSSPMPYATCLAQLNGLPYEGITNPSLPGILPDETGGIVLCPFGLKPEVDLPITVWADIVRMLRSYGEKVTLVADPDQRLDSAYFTEDATASTWSLTEKLELLAKAKLIVGMPNVYTWLSTGWAKKMVVYYPSTVNNARWFGFFGHGYSYILLGYEPHAVRIPLLIAGLRLAIGKL